jgi:hypothetical protein
MEKTGKHQIGKGTKSTQIVLTLFAIVTPLLVGGLFFLFPKKNPVQISPEAVVGTKKNSDLKKETVGDMGGISVRVPLYFSKFAEYEGDPGWSGKRVGPVPVRDSKSKLVGFGFDVRYPDMAGLSSPEITKSKATFTIYNTPWFRGIITTGINFGDGLFLQRMSESIGKRGSLAFEKQVEKQFGLEVHTPIGVKPETRIPGRHIDDDNDIYIFRDESGGVKTYIECTNINHDAAPCHQYFNLTPKAKVKVAITYRRGLLPEWAQMQESVSKLLLSFEIP